jgi:ABC-2 type transport system ATP-binding protein
MVPTRGKMKVRGSIAALLELASGFDGDLTVRENTYLRGAMLGYTRRFMDEKYDEIIDFAELREFQDRKFKQLSSGMKSRLAFSIACLVNPDILILDEVLSVGDGAFRKKSGDRMKEILSSGKTGVLVSHSVGQIRELCNKVLWLDHGNQIAFSDDVELYCDAYEEFLATKKLPKNMEDVKTLAEGHAVRLDAERRKKQEATAKRLEKMIEKGSSDEAVMAAVRILRKSRPDLLVDNYQEVLENPPLPEVDED